MKINYKGFEINVEREKSLGGWDATYYYVMEKDSGICWLLGNGLRI